jgi:hypothetical protein
MPGSVLDCRDSARRNIVKRNKALVLLWPLGTVVIAALILAAGLLALIGIVLLAASRRGRVGKPEPSRSGLASVRQLGGPPADVILTPPSEATLGRTA